MAEPTAGRQPAPIPIPMPDSLDLDALAEAGADAGSATAAPAPLLVYVPPGYIVRKKAARPATGRVTPAASRRRGAVALGLSLTLVAGVLVGYLAGFAVARRTGDASVTVTVHSTGQP